MLDDGSYGSEGMEEAIRLYVGLNETKFNRHAIATGGYCCISPVYSKTERTKKKNPNRAPIGDEVIQDSGAFYDGPGQRLSFDEALTRQIEHAESQGYADQIVARASYDLLIDEKWENGTRYKKRWTAKEADAAVLETVAAAAFLRFRSGDRVPHILSAQGVDAEQYLYCVKSIIPLLEEGDILGLGGWCITGRNREKMLPEFLRSIRLVMPYAGDNGIRRIHIWGVMLAEALGPLLWMCDQYNIRLSTDSSGPSWKPAFGDWGYAEWRDKSYEQPPVETRGLERIRHIAATRDWLSNFRSTQWYREP